jgi:amino acid transporter
MISLLTQKLSDPHFLIGALITVAVFATAVTILLPVLSGSALKSRMKSSPSNAKPFARASGPVSPPKATVAAACVISRSRASGNSLKSSISNARWLTKRRLLRSGKRASGGKIRSTSSCSCVSCCLLG